MLLECGTGVVAAIERAQRLGQAVIGVSELRIAGDGALEMRDRLGVTATCRASFALYNTKAEVDALITALTKAHDLFA